MRVTRKQAEAYASWKVPLCSWTSQRLAESYLAALDVVEAVVEEADADRAEIMAARGCNVQAQRQAAERSLKARVAREAALQAWRGAKRYEEGA